MGRGEYAWNGHEAGFFVSVGTAASITKLAERRRSLDRFIGYHNGLRPHLGIGGRTSGQRLTDLMAA
jgi:hypothetical protein